MLHFKRRAGFDTATVYTSELSSRARYIVCSNDGSNWTAQFVTPSGNVRDVLRRVAAETACVAHLDVRT
jgi:Mn-containing catalase